MGKFLYVSSFAQIALLLWSATAFARPGESTPNLYSAPIGSHPIDSFCQERATHALREDKNIQIYAREYCNNCGQVSCEQGAEARLDIFFPAGGAENLCFRSIVNFERRLNRFCALQPQLVTPISDSELQQSQAQTDTANGAQLLGRNAFQLNSAAKALSIQQSIADEGFSKAAESMKFSRNQANLYRGFPLLNARFQQLEQFLQNKYAVLFDQLRSRSEVNSKRFEDWSSKVQARATALNGGEPVLLNDEQQSELALASSHPVADRFNEQLKTEKGGARVDAESATASEYGDAESLAPIEANGAASAANDQDSVAGTESRLTETRETAAETIAVSRQLTAGQRVAFEQSIIALGGDAAAVEAIATNLESVAPRLDAALQELRAEGRKIYASVGSTENANAEVKRALTLRAEELGVPGLLNQLYMVDANGQQNAVASLLATDSIYNGGQNFPGYAASADAFVEANLTNGGYFGTGNLEIQAPLDPSALTGETIRKNLSAGIGEVRENFTARFQELDGYEKSLSEIGAKRVVGGQGEMALPDLEQAQGWGMPNAELFDGFVEGDYRSLLRDITFKYPEAAAHVAQSSPEKAGIIREALGASIENDQLKDGALVAGEVGVSVGSLFLGGPLGKGVTKGVSFVGRRTGADKALASGLASVGLSASRADRFFSASAGVLTNSKLAVGLGSAGTALSGAGWLAAEAQLNSAQLALLSDPNVKGFELLTKVQETADDKKFWAGISSVGSGVSLASGARALAQNGRATAASEIGTGQAGAGAARSAAQDPATQYRNFLDGDGPQPTQRLGNAVDEPSWEAILAGTEAHRRELAARNAPIVPALGTDSAGNVAAESIVRAPITTIFPSEQEVRTALRITDRLPPTPAQLEAAKTQVISRNAAVSFAEEEAKKAGWVPEQSNTPFMTTTDFTSNPLRLATEPNMHASSPAYGFREGWFHLEAHGNIGSVTIGNEIFGLDQLARSVRAAGHKPGQPVNFLSCWGGAVCERTGIANAQTLANELQAPVVAPSHPFGIDRLNITPGNGDYNDYVGEWRLFTPTPAPNP